MREKLSTAAFCLLFAVCFGGVGVLTGWLAGTVLHDGIRARDWVKVRAEVIGDKTYRYQWEGRSYESERLTLLPFGSSDVDGSEEVAERFARAKSEERPVTVFVNPQDPREAVAEASIPWMFLVFMVPFVFGFGGVGLGALWMMCLALIPSRPRPTANDVVSGPLAMWIFAFFWNVIAFPIAIGVVPQIIEDGEWLGLFVLLFPLIGVFLLWAAVAATIGRLRRGKAALQLDVATPRVGETLAGHIRFPRGVSAGKRFTLRLECNRTTEGDEESTTQVYWSREVEARAVDAGSGVRIPFRIDVPSNMPPTGESDDGDHAWRLSIREPGSQQPLESIEVRLARSSFEPRIEAEEEKPLAGPLADALRERLGARFDESRLSPEQRAAFANISAGQQAAVARIVTWTPNVKKVVIAIVVLVIAFEVLPWVIAFALN